MSKNAATYLSVLSFIIVVISFVLVIALVYIPGKKAVAALDKTYNDALLLYQKSQSLIPKIEQILTVANQIVSQLNV
jgi:uncharacterized protein YoxC